MEREKFQTEMQRLIKTYGDGPYPEMRLGILYAQLEHIPSFEFEAIVSHLIATERRAPMLAEFITARNELVASRRAGQRLIAGVKSARDILNLPAGGADPDYVALCKRILRDRLEGRITFEQFHQKMNELDSVANEMTKAKGGRLENYTWLHDELRYTRQGV